ncbi:MAG: hypothetical protein DKM23_04425 [Candidatus Melainabacteria bacterium]|nr:MAG: hypothetical protein DKM24_05035 [Candidatus Melainabacteria bacterium]RAI11557.1 MAG: hypothetical protein DKM23_04425 [Candidatus Melainabacteria bacterium]
MSNSYNNFDSNNFDRNSMIKQRVSEVTAYMYKQFCDYQHINENTSEIFANMANVAKEVVEQLKQSFASRGVATENIWVKFDTKVPAIIINVFWLQYSFTMRCNFKPQALFREGSTSLYSGRIMAVKGDYFVAVANAKTPDAEMACLLDKELASLYVPANKMENAIIKARYGSKEIPLNQTDAGREFVLKITESIVTDTMYHEEGARKSFNI